MNYPLVDIDLKQSWGGSFCDHDNRYTMKVYIFVAKLKFVGRDIPKNCCLKIYVC